MAAGLSFSITSPLRNAVVGRNVAVSGRARSFGGGAFSVREVRVGFGSGPGELAQLAQGSWTCTISPLPGLPGGVTLRITATARGTFFEETGAEEPFEETTTVDVVLDGTVPDVLTIDSFATPVTTAPGRPHILDLSGTAADAQTGISKVQLKLDNGPFADVVDIVGNGAGSLRWRQKAVKVPAGAHRFTVLALDGADNRRERTAEIIVRLPFEPGAVDQVFEPTRYLLDLQAFARRYVKIAGTTEALTPAMLAARFHQPFDRLTGLALFEQATRPISQARIAVEVLRARLDAPAPHELDQRFRALAYQTFLRALGTSYDELRLARFAETGTREKLATRLGIGLVAVRPDRLDELTVSPGTITDDQLEQLSGYRSTAPNDPLQPSVESAKVLLWRRDALRAQWQSDDEVQRDSADGPRPVLDPDVIGEGHLRNRLSGDPAFALWRGRQTWITDMLAKIRQEAQIGVDPLARFDHVVATFVGAVDLPGLAAQDANGTDIQPDLVPRELSLEAFRFLARSRGLLVDGMLLDTEWDDVMAILLQVQKRRLYRTWRLSERRAGIVLEPASFNLDATASGQPDSTPRWRSQRAEYLAWRSTLAARIAAAANLETGYQRIVDATEAVVLPALRDALVVELAASEESPEDAAERLSRALRIGLRADAGQRTTRVDQALETLHAVLFSARAGQLDTEGTGQGWTIGLEPTAEREFDREWSWMGSFGGWRSANRVFAYPENQLFPALYAGESAERPPTSAYLQFIERLRGERRLTPEGARQIAADYIGVAAPGLTLTDELSDADLVKLQKTSEELHVTLPSMPHREIFWLVPMAIAAKLQEAGQFVAALGWYRTVYAYHLPQANRRIYHGLTVESDRHSTYDRAPQWLIKELNPHIFARDRRNCYTRATIMAIAGCFNAFADDEFTQSSADANARARTLYETAIDLLDLPEAAPETGADVPFPPNPVWESMRDHSRSGLNKIRRGLNIAGVPNPGSGFETMLPSQYRYGVLVERAKNLVGIAQQVEAAYLSALEQRDAKTYDSLRARHDLEVAGSTVVMQIVKTIDADVGIRQAELQRERAQMQDDHYDKLISDGYSAWEQAGLDAQKLALGLHAAAGVFGILTGSTKAGFSFGTLGTSEIAGALSAFAAAASTGGQIAQTIASYERREQDWQLQRSLAREDVAIGGEQVRHAYIQRQLAEQEKSLAQLQVAHAEAVAVFLATRFTNAELFEWMSGVLGRVYAFFLQQATALALLAEAQLAFERQELTIGFVGSDYWRDASAGSSAPDRRGLTGSARLLQDVTRLDEYAFDTDRRKLHMTQTFPLSQIAAFELQQFRETGVLTFATQQELFDREFPGHYLRLIKRIRVSFIALIPPVRGVRATLSASGVSRTVVARGPFDTVTLRRQPESIAFTSPINATGLFELEPESGLLLPFEGMGVDTVLQLALPKAANPFDYRTIADVLFTIEYTALDSADYRERVVRELDRRYSADSTFSIRNRFPDAWYAMNNPENEPDRRMRAVLPLRAENFPPHIHDLRVAHVTVFVLRRDELADELTFASLRHTVGSQAVTSDEVSTTGGIASTRRPGGTAWGILLGMEPAGDWELAVHDDPVVRSWFTDGRVEDIVLVLTLSGTTPAWP